MRRRFLALVILAGSCATSRKVAEVANDVAATAGIVRAAAQRYIPDPPPNPRLTPREQAEVNLAPAVVMMGIAIWHFAEEWRAANADAGVPVDAGVP